VNDAARAISSFDEVVEGQAIPVLERLSDRLQALERHEPVGGT